MSKTDLRIRPIYHRLKNRIEAHICIAFTAYSIYKELERILYKEKSSLSLKKAAELTVEFEDKKKLYKNVPLEVWFELKYHESKEYYYKSQIKYDFVPV
jgi:hypothetical protein